MNQSSRPVLFTSRRGAALSTSQPCLSRPWRAFDRIIRCCFLVQEQYGGIHSVRFDSQLSPWLSRLAHLRFKRSRLTKAITSHTGLVGHARHRLNRALSSSNRKPSSAERPPVSNQRPSPLARLIQGPEAERDESIHWIPLDRYILARAARLSSSPLLSRPDPHR